MPERIFITYTNATAVPYQGTTLGHHAVLNYIDSKGNHYTLEGKPEHKFDRNAEKLAAVLREELLSNGASNTDSPLFRALTGRLRWSGDRNAHGIRLADAAIVSFLARPSARGALAHPSK